MQATRAFFRRPSLRLAEGEVTHVPRVELDVRRALSQHAAYLEVLRQHGLSLMELPELPDQPDGLFVEDVVVMLDGRALLTRPGAVSRRGELPSTERALRQLGLAPQRIEAPATLDGGDVLVLDQHILVGRSTRTNQHALAQLACFAEGSGRAVQSVDVVGALHLKTALTRLPDGSLIAVAEHVDIALLTRQGFCVHRAPEASGGDVLCLGQSVLLPTAAPRTAQLLRDLGFAVVSLDISELQKLEAGVTCMSVLW